MEGVIIIESFLSTGEGDPLGGPLFVSAHYRSFLKTIAGAPNYIFPSQVDDTHIVGPMNEMTCAFDHLLTQLTLIGLKVNVSKCKLWSPLGISLSIKIPHAYTLVTNGLRILGVLMSFQNFVTHFLDEVLFQDVVHIDDLPFLGNAHVVLGILFSCVARRPSYFTSTIHLSFSFLSFLVSFDRKIMQVCENIMGPDY